MRVLVACEYSGRVREAFRARGHEAWSIDLLPAEDDSPFHIVGDVLSYLNDHCRYFDLMIAHPPCTYLCNSGVRWLWKAGFDHEGVPDVVENQARWRLMRESAEFFAKLMLQPIPKIAAENPIMHSYARREIERHLVNAGWTGMPKTAFVQPWWFGDPFFKATGFTLRGLPPLVEDTNLSLRAQRPAPGTAEHKAWSAIHNASPSPTRWKERSRTYQGIADAMAAQWR